MADIKVGDLIHVRRLDEEDVRMLVYVTRLASTTGSFQGTAIYGDPYASERPEVYVSAQMGDEYELADTSVLETLTDEECAMIMRWKLTHGESHGA